MKAAIFLNGEKFEGAIDLSDSYIICCDGAYAFLKDRGIKPDETIGDFDSLGFVPEGGIKFNAEKNFTDGEAAMERAISLKPSKIELYCGGGGREDHFLSNVHMLEKAYNAGIEAEMVTNYSRIFLKGAPFRLKTGRGRTVSLLPLKDNVHINESKGLKYTLSGLTLKAGDGAGRGISNLTTEEEIFIGISCGISIVFLIDKEYN